MDRKYRFVVKLCDTTKLITVADKQDVEKRAKEVFCVGEDYAVEYFDAGFGVYVEPESPEDFPDELGKLRLFRRNATPNAEPVIPESDR